MKKVLFLILMLCVEISVCAQVTRKMQREDDGTVWYQTVENDKYGVEFQGKQILPNKYEYISYAGKAYGVYYFDVLVSRGASFYDEVCSLFNNKGEEIISFNKGYHGFRVVYNKDGYLLLGVHKGHDDGIIDGRTGKVVVPLRDDYNWFPKFDSSRRKFYSYADDNKTQRIDVPFYAENMTKISTSSSSSASSSKSTMADCPQCKGRSGNSFCAWCHGMGKYNTSIWNNPAPNYSGGSTVSGGTVGSGTTTGGGNNPSSSHQCRVCNGTGSEIYEPYTGSGRSVYCNICRRNFSHAHTHRQCKTCNGTGRVSY